MKRQTKRGGTGSRIVTRESEPQHLQVLPGEDAPAQALGTVPDHVKAVFLQAAELAADRLLATMADDKGWQAMRPADQKAFIELAFLRAWGAPVSKSLSVELSSSDADAVAASLAGMHAALPEQRQRTVEPVEATPLPTSATRLKRGAQRR